MKRSLDELAQFQIDAAERQRLLELGKIPIEPASADDTKALTRTVQAAAAAPRQTGPGQR